ncbi:unnamed protein product [Ixodes hexagonus]
MKFLGVPDWIILVVTGLVLLYLYAASYRNYWKEQNVVHEKFSLIFASAARMFFKPFNLVDQDRYKQFRKLFGVYEGGKPVLFVADPDLVKLVFVKDFTLLPNRRVMEVFDPLLDNMMSILPVQKWRRIRPAASPAFSTGKLRRMNPLIDDCARKTSEHLKETAEKDGELELKQFYTNYSLDVIARCAFATRLDSHTQETNEFVKKAKEATSGKITFPILLFLLFPGIFKLLKIRPFKSDFLLFFKDLCLKIIGDRKEKQIVRKYCLYLYFLQLMMDAQDGSIAAAAEIASSTDEKLFNLDSELKTDTSFLGGIKALTEDEAMSQCVLFFAAGHDTTSSVIAYATYLLALHPETQAMLRKEADECFKQHGPQPSLDVISKLKYLHGVVSETLRMFPPAVRLERTSPSDYVLGDTGIKVPKGCTVAVPIYAMHHDPEFFPDPAKFDPERFSDENIDYIRPYTYLPFGAGPRNCIGMRFALAAIKLSVLHSVHSVEFVRTENTKVSVVSRVAHSLPRAHIEYNIYIYTMRRGGSARGRGIPSPTILRAGLFSYIVKAVKTRSRRIWAHETRNFETENAYEGVKPVLFVADPELVKLVLVKDFSFLPNRRRLEFFDPILDNMLVLLPVEKWRRIRPAISPAFSTGKLRKMSSLIDDCARKTAEHLKETAENEGEVDVKQFYGNYSLDVIARCAFATRLDSHSQETNEFVTKARQAFSGSVFFDASLSVFFPGIFKLLRMKATTSGVFLYFKKLCLKIISDRKEQQSRQEDFLQLMMDAREGSITAEAEIASSTDEKLFNIDSELKTDTSFAGGVKALTEDEVMAQCVVFFIAGQDALSSVITFTTYLLALYPEIQAKLREEADECFKLHGPQPSLDVVSKLKYLHRVVSESMRMFPPGPRIERTSPTDYVLGDTGIKVPKDCVVAVPVYAIHHDPEYFPDPTKFDPERFSDENIDSIRPYTYLPFGAGPRNCIGMRFALAAVKLSILHSVHSVEFVRTNNTKKLVPQNSVPCVSTDQDVNGRKMKLLGIPDWAILMVTALVLLYLYAARYRNYWREQNVVHEKFSLIFPSAKRMFFKPFHIMDQERYNKFGKLFGVYEGVKPVLVVADPELVKLVLVKDFPSLSNRRLIQFFDPILDNMMGLLPAEKWRRIRPAASPAFSTGKLRKMNSLIDDCARQTTEHLKETAEKEGELDVKQFFGNYALDVIARCAFGTRLDTHSEETNEFVTKARQAFSNRLSLPLFLLMLFPGIFKLLRMKAINSEAFLYFKKLSLKIIGDRKQKQSRQEDFLQLMMDAREGSIASEAEIASSTDEKLFNLDSELKTDTSFVGGVKALTEDEAMAQCVLFFLAGQDTTSSVIAYTTYLLALHPEIQARLREEADECFKQHGPRPSLDVVSKLKYLHGVVSESLRMFPPGPRLERTSPSDYVLGDTGIKVPKGCVVAVPVYAMHRDPEYFPDPTKFDPTRFSDENIDSIRPYTYLPFGAGPRNCIGMRFALAAVKLSLLHSVHNVQFVCTNNTKVPLEFVKGFGVFNAKNITVGIRKRSI